MRFGRWTTIRRVYIPAKVHWLCSCDCGNEREVWDFSLLRGQSQSCGCLHGLIQMARQTTHGLSDSREHRIWRAMKQRCTNSRSSNYSYYGGRGITICSRWLNSFENFYADMGPCPKGLTLERKNVNGNYTPRNCYWATRLQQALNRRPNEACPAGHLYTDKNTFVLRDGERGCKICRRARWQRYEEKRQRLVA
jgi:hypothetical protein